MPRAKPKRGTTTWQPGPIRLGEADAAELIDLLGRNSSEPEAQQAVALVVRAVSLYTGGVAVLATVPRAANARVALNNLARRAAEFLDELEGLHPWIKSGLFPAANNVEAGLGQLIAVIDSAKTQVAGKESRGRQDAAAEVCREVVRRLREIFRRFLVPTSSRERKRCGSVQDLSELESDELEFVRGALKLGDIPVPKRRALRRLFLHPDCLLREERNLIVERAKAERYRSDSMGRCPHVKTPHAGRACEQCQRLTVSMEAEAQGRDPPPSDQPRKRRRIQ